MAEKKTTPRDFTWKYEHTNPFAKLHEGEPWFFIRAQDKLAGPAVQAYGALLKKESEAAFAAGNQALSSNLLKQALGILVMVRAIEDWQCDNKQFVKMPD